MVSEGYGMNDLAVTLLHDYASKQSTSTAGSTG